MNVVSFSQNILLCCAHPSCNGVRWEQANMLRWSGVNDAVTQCRATPGLPRVRQKQDHLLLDHSWPQVTETMEKKTTDKVGGVTVPFPALWQPLSFGTSEYPLPFHLDHQASDHGDNMAKCQQGQEMAGIQFQLSLLLPHYVIKSLG